MNKTGRLTDQQKIDIVKEYTTTKTNCAIIGRKYGKSQQTINRLLRRRGILIENDLSKIHNKYELDETFFDKIDTEEKAYFLGLLYADGYNGVSRNIISMGLQEDDVLILEKFKSAIKSNRPLGIINYKNKNWKRIVYIKLHSKNICKKLCDLGCPQKKTFVLKFPNKEQVPEHLICHFIRGYFDGDGCVTLCKYKKYIQPKISIASNIDFVNGLKSVLENKYSIQCSIDSNKRQSKTPSLRIINGEMKKNILGFMNLMYENATIYLERKYNKCIEIKQRLDKDGKII